MHVDIVRVSQSAETLAKKIKKQKLLGLYTHRVFKSLP